MSNKGKMKNVHIGSDGAQNLKKLIIDNDAEILYEEYSVTVDWLNPEKELIQAMERSKKIEITHEEGSIYSIKYRDY